MPRQWQSKGQAVWRVCSNVLLTFFGALFLSAGAFRIGAAIVGSSFFYVLLGSLLLLSHNEQARIYLLKVLPRPLLVYLYEKSLLDVLIEPSRLSRVYTLLALSSVLGDAEIRTLTDALPIECDVMRRPGLIHFLPGVVQRIFAPIDDGNNWEGSRRQQVATRVQLALALNESDTDGTNNNTNNNSSSNGGEDEDGSDLGDADGTDTNVEAVAERVEELPAFPSPMPSPVSLGDYFTLPFLYRRQEELEEDTGVDERETMSVDASVAAVAEASAAGITTSASACVQQTARQIRHVNAAPIVTAASTETYGFSHATRIVAHAQVRPRPSSPTTFDLAVADMGASRLGSLAQSVTESFLRQASAAAADAGWSAATGGAVSDTVLLTSCLALSSAAVFISNQRQNLQRFGVVRRLLEAGTGLAAGVAIASGVALSLRTGAKLIMLCDDDSSAARRDHSMTPARQERLRVYRSLQSIWERSCRRCAAYSRHLQAHTAAYTASLCVALTVLLAWRLKAKWRNVKWLGLLLLNNISTGVDRARLALQADP